MATELKSYTIVPDSLYVERKADLQLHSIVEAMQRPGYVLVSRQMGKTNLLLRAKRKWESTSDLYVYVDMSNIDESEKECFQSLIDTAIDTHEELLGSLRERIRDLRQANISKSPVQAHNEELRVLLSVIEGKLVFILDEIDSLTRTSFSDNVFSQIRSVYFSRINYPVLEKLTYVLSGVVEPTDIIKNPKISPFNIGEKILLDDFSHDEYMSFIEKAGLEIFGDDVLDRIYYWTGGNPRMTWDVCYELQHKENLTPEVVDTLVKKMYLTTFDKAPVDTIRNLVKEDRILRDAIIQLAYDKGNTLSDKIKSKLYLSGIVNYSDNNIKIKNRIIKESLSISWLQKVEEEEKGLLTYAIELHEKGYYQESAEKFETYLNNNDFPEENASIYYFYLGSCYFHLKDFEKSLSYLTKKPIDRHLSTVDYCTENFLSGADCMNIGLYKEALAYFDNVISSDIKDWYYYSSKLNSLAAKTRLAKDDSEQLKEVENEYKSLLALSDKPGMKNVKLYAAYQLAGMYRTNQKEESSRFYDVALLNALEADKPRILTEKFYVAVDEEKSTIIKALVSSIEKTDSIPKTLEPDKALSIDEDVLAEALFIIYSYDYDSWNNLREKLQLFPYSYGDTLYFIFQKGFSHTSELFGDGQSRLIDELINNINHQDYNISHEVVPSIYKFNALINYSENSAQNYLLHLKNTDSQIDVFGLIVISKYTASQLEKNCFHIICELVWVLDRFNNDPTVPELEPRAFIEYCILASYYASFDQKHALEISKLILSHIDNDIKQVNEKARENLTSIKGFALHAQSQLTIREPIRSENNYGRNDRIKVRYLQTGKVVEIKYKYVENDLNSGKCIIVED